GHSRFFTDRKDILTTLHTHFTSVQAFPQTRTLALSGLAGSGKTQIAVEYAHLYKHEYQATLWLEATSRNSLSKAIAPLAELLSFRAQDRVDEEHLFNAVKCWLQQQEQWLLIIDDLRDFQLMDLFIPSRSSGHVLLTTHSQATGDLAHLVPVAQMTMKDSVLFLLRRAKTIEEQASLNEASETDRAQATAIVQEFEGWTLALDQAGAYIEETGCDLAGYLKLYREQGATLLTERGQFARAHPDSVVRTLSLLFKEAAQEYPGTLDLLRLCAFLHPDAIPCEMIEQGALALDRPLRVLAAEAGTLYKFIATLRKFSLIQRRTDTTVLSIHRVVQAILKEELMPKQRHQWAIQAVRLMNRAFPDAEFSNWPTCEKYFSQARRCDELITEFQLKQKEAADLLQRLGSYCYQRAHYQEAETYLATALQMYKQGNRSDQSAISLTLNDLGLLYHRQGKYQVAEEHYLHARAIREEVAESDPSSIVQTLNNLGLLYKDWGKYHQAEELYQRILSIDGRTVGPDHLDTATYLCNLAQVY
ncbi:MAG: tetratricopeptide repeat protein, partial [Ktedonobacteraceae bacterium]